MTVLKLNRQFFLQFLSDKCYDILLMIMVFLVFKTASKNYIITKTKKYSFRHQIDCSLEVVILLFLFTVD